ncbi:MAG TPA: acylphosphatase [Ktedonobacterales bacterium]|jgi:acylphosphatase|nr:acylphosphatase [Ktedonobacterales bacterium]
MSEARPDTLRLTMRVHGYVQGVGFRYFVRREASALGLRGFVRNLDDDGVEVVAEGNRTRLEQLVPIVERGPSAAEVERVEVIWSAGTGAFSAFQVRH